MLCRRQALTFDVEILRITSEMDNFPLKKSDDEWKKELTPQEIPGKAAVLLILK